MFDFFFRSKAITVDCFVNSHRVAESYPIRRAFHHVPDWWRNLSEVYVTPNDVTNKPYEQATMRTCYGFISLYRKGFILPLWTDIDLFVDENGYAYHTANKFCKIETHAPSQYGDRFSDYYHIKIKSPWFFKEKRGIDFMFIPCTWSHLAYAPRLRGLSGVVNYKHQHATHVNCFMPKETGSFRLEAGLPLVHIIPLSESNAKIKIHVLDDREYSKLATKMDNHTFTKSHISVVKSDKRCPISEVNND